MTYQNDYNKVNSNGDNNKSNDDDDDYDDDDDDIDISSNNNNQIMINKERGNTCVLYVLYGLWVSTELSVSIKTTSTSRFLVLANIPIFN